MSNVTLIRWETVPQNMSRMIIDLFAILRPEVREGRLRVIIEEDRVQRREGNLKKERM